VFVETFKKRARWVPFHRSLGRELKTYLAARREYAPANDVDRFFVGTNHRSLPHGTASEAIRNLFQQAGLKPAQGGGPRPYDLRHAFAVHRLSRWYRQGVDLHARPPWLSAYMGHTDIIGTESYLHATPELLEMAGNRLRRRYLQPTQTETFEP
jgi:integrase/recombinase XerD